MIPCTKIQVRMIVEVLTGVAEADEQDFEVLLEHAKADAVDKLKRLLAGKPRVGRMEDAGQARIISIETVTFTLDARAIGEKVDSQ